VTTGRVLLRIGLLAAAFGLGLLVLGWWSAPVIAAAWGWLAWSARRPALTAAVAALVAWGAAWGWSFTRGAGPALADLLGAVAGVARIWFVIATLLLPLLLASSSAALFGALRRLQRERSPRRG
jgi:hypothetical protein